MSIFTLTVMTTADQYAVKKGIAPCTEGMIPPEGGIAAPVASLAEPPPAAEGRTESFGGTDHLGHAGPVVMSTGLVPVIHDLLSLVSVRGSLSVESATSTHIRNKPTCQQPKHSRS